LLKWALKNVHLIVVLNKALEDRYHQLGVSESKIIIMSSAVDARKFSQLRSREEERKLAGIEEKDTVVCYAGSLKEEKGIFTLIKSMGYLLHVKLLVVGGLERELRKAREFCRKNRIESVHFIGFVPPLEVPKYLLLADILVLPNSGKYRSSAQYTSSLKFYEYMAVPRPIVVTDVPAVREMVNELRDTERICWVRPDDARDLARGIQSVMKFIEDHSGLENKWRVGNDAIFDWCDRARQIVEQIDR